MSRMIMLLFLSGVSLLSVGCQSSALRENFIRPMEEAHGREAWLAHDALHMDVDLVYGGNPVMQATFLFETKGPKARMDVKGGPVVVYDGEEAWITPGQAKMPRARFHVLTWPWFLVTPFKMSDAGVTMASAGELPMQGETMPTAMMTFAGDMGDTPDDWYLLYMDAESKLLTAMSYIVTYGKPLEKANEEPHCITYHDFDVISGATFSKHWKVWNWTKEKGVHGEPLAEIKLSNIWFATPEPETFARPENARTLPYPEPEAEAG